MDFPINNGDFSMVILVYLTGISGIGVYIGNASLAGHTPKSCRKDVRSDSLRSRFNISLVVDQATIGW